MSEMNELKKKDINCPEDLAISAFYDGEIAPDSPESKHIEACPACQEKLASYKRIDNALNSMLDEATPSDISERIRQRVHSKLDKTEKHIEFNFSQVLKIAAGLVICAGAVTIYFNSQKAIDPATPSDKPVKVEKGNTETADTIAQNDDKLSKYRYRGTGAGSVIESSNLENVSFGGVESPIRRRDNLRTIPPVSIKEVVHQVWVYPSSNDAIQKITDIMTLVGVPHTRVSIKVKGKTIELKANMSKSQLVYFVKHFSSAKAELLVPVAPQPEQKFFTGKASDRIEYSAEIIANQY